MSDPPEPISRSPPGASSLAPRSWRAIAANFAWLSGERAVDLAITLLVTVLVARHLGPERFGILGYLIGLAALLGSVAPLGMDRILVIELTRASQDTNRLLGTSTVLKLCSGTAVGAGMIAAVLVLSPRLEHAALFGGLFAAAAIVRAFDGPELAFNAHTKSRYPVLANSTGRAAMALVRLALIYLSAALTAFVAASALESVLIVLMLLVFYRIQGGDFASWRFDGALARGLLRRGFPLLMASLATAMLMRLGVVMVERLGSDAEAGIYVGAVRLADTCGLVAANLIASIGPTLISIRSQSAERYLEGIARLMQGVSAALTVLAVAICLASDQLIGLLLGPSFIGTASVLRIYIWSAPLIALGLVELQWLVVEGYETFVLIRAAVGAAVNLAANLLLIPRYGAAGAAWAAVAAQFASCILTNLGYDARTRRIFVLQIRALLWLDLSRLWARRPANTEA
jgi:O-antigen/teichoic acid export membrane protein